MKKINRILIVFLAVLTLAGCSKDWLDVNTDPNNPASASAELTLPAAEIGIAAHVGGYYNLIGGFWSQYWSQSNAANQYKYLDQYQIQSGDFNDIWNQMYSDPLMDLQFVKKEALEKENWTYYLMATVLEAYAYQVMVDLYNDVPFFEAFRGESELNFSPKYDNGKVIYDTLIARIDNALAKGSTELTAAQIKGDFLFAADYDTWVEFANTLKLKMFMRQMYSHPAEAQAGVAALYAANASFLTQDAGIDIYINEEKKDNPLYASNVRKLNVGTNLRVSTTIFRYFEANSDPRLNYIVSSGTLPMPQGGFNIPSAELDPPAVAVFAQAPTDPVYFISEVESYLLQAEAIARGWGTGDAKALYDAAVSEAFARYGEDASSFIGTGGVYEYPNSATFEVNQEAIIMAKWAAMAGNQSIEAFFESNRTGYPRKSAVAPWLNGTYNVAYQGGQISYSLEGVTGGLFPKRLLYPQDEVNLNTNFPGQTSVTDKVWWDKK
ncbi:MAG: SusD/RagB family nutrient-binding outer membrane lipoprotein [Bacteroidota bacterium]|nr:MAG: SusD/RagB family nutrient-binding outer membrane lipoprotein [Bacteroidota bacterium]